MKMYDIPIRDHEPGDFIKDMHDGMMIMIRDGKNPEKHEEYLRMINKIEKQYPHDMEKTNSKEIFFIKGRRYAKDKNGVIVQQDALPYTYDAAYSAIYDTPAYARKSELLQAMRYGFCCAAHGRRINKILDVGYGNGAFMKFVAQQVPLVCGYDVTDVPVPEGTKKVDKITEGADVVTFWDCLEHFHNIDFLSDLQAETLVVSLPWCHFYIEHDKKSGIGWMETKYKHLKPDEHIRHFDKAALKNTVEQYGWNEIAHNMHEDIIRKSEHGLPNILTMAFKRR